MEKKKKLINIRGAGGSGKTTAVKQFCNRHGITVEKVSTPFAVLPVSLINGGKIVVLGNYLINTSCVGPDRFKNGKKDIIDLIMEVADIYNPDIIIYEHMVSSHLFNSTKEIAEVASVFGYEYFGVQISISEEKRIANYEKRTGKDMSSKYLNKKSDFNINNGRRIDITSDKLREFGLSVITIDANEIPYEEMWRIVENAIC